MKGKTVKGFFIFLFAFLFITNSFAQKDFYIPLNIKQAYEKGTRAYDGKPGPNYWQNHSQYNINVNINPATKLLQGSEDIVYYNNSPDSLSQIVVRLYQNISKPNARRDFYLNDEAMTNGMEIRKISVENINVDPNDKSKVRISGTNLFLTLDKKLAPKSTTNISFNWDFKIPAVQTIRFGSYDSTSMFIAYWYPQISVYDDIDGWDKMDYTGTLEMYNDFSDFNVKITVPAGFHVWSTGVWQNPDEILNTKYLDRYKLALQSDDVIRIFEKEDLISNNIYKIKNGTQTFNYAASNTPDFAFAISDHYLWDAVSFKPEKNSDRRVYCTAAYKESSKDFVNVAHYAEESLKYYSYKIPGVPFPYPSATVFNGAGGMEFPMIVNNGSASSKAGTVHLTSHELLHSYFPFYMGTNERKYPFMDEGWAVMLPFDLQERLAEGYKPRVNTTKLFESFAGNEYELPLMIPSPTLNWQSYRNSAYNKPALAYDFLRQTLGDSLFLKAMKTYMGRWNGKHPIPTDFFFTFNNVVGKDLGWYWKPWFYDFGFPDLAISNVKQKKNSIVITVINKGNLPLPVKLQVMFNDIVVKEIYKTPEVWSKGKNKVDVKIEGVKNFDAVILGSETIPDINNINNVYIK
jgi:hypothetical protein